MTASSTTTVEDHWKDADLERLPEELHLVVAWLGGANRVGEAGCVSRQVVLGRGGARLGDPAPRLSFHQQRPGENAATLPLDAPRLSRTQLIITPTGGALRVVSVGRCPLLHNGREVTETVVLPGDVLTLLNTLVLLVEWRPKVILPSEAMTPPFEFGKPDPFGIVGESPASWAQRSTLARLADRPGAVLVLGPSGAGKELAVRALHGRSSRARRPLVSRNAATLPAALLDAELFGNLKNYPNAGSPERPGLIGQAHEGTLFLDEIGQLPAEQQTHLLRFLDQGEYQRLGEAQVRRADVRFVAATNAPLETLKQDFLARFRHHTRVSGFSERKSDIPLMMLAIVAAAARQTRDFERFIDPKTCQPRIHPQLVQQLLCHEYTLHHRELERLLHLALDNSPGDRVRDSAALLAELFPVTQAAHRGQLTKEAIERALIINDGNMGLTASTLSLSSRYTLYRLMKQYGIRRRA